MNNYTEEKPTAPGFYWVLHPDRPDGVFVVEVAERAGELVFENELYPEYYNGYVWSKYAIQPPPTT